MATTEHDIVRRGYLNVVRNPKDGVLGSLTTTVTSRRNWVILRKESHGRSSRLELYRNEEQVTDNNFGRDILLDQMRTVQRAERKKAFVVVMADETLLFMCSSRADTDDWLSDIRRYRGGRRSESSFSDSDGVPDNSVGRDIYEVVPDDETFPVNLRKSNSMRFSGPCLLEVLRDFDRNLFHVALYSEDEPPRLIMKWQIDHIRQYGSNQMAFKFQSGGKSPTGVDWFIVDTEPGSATRVHKAVDYWAKHIVEQARNMRHGPQRASSVGTTPRQGPVSPVNSVSSVGSGHSGSFPRGTYAPLSTENRVQPSVYATPDQHEGARKPPVSVPPRGPQGQSSSHYQPLRPVTKETSHSTYEDLEPRTRVPGGGVAGPNPSPNSTYQPLNMTTRNPTNESSYMGLKEARS